MESLALRTGSRRELVDVTALAERAVSRSGVREGICLVYSPHTTAGVAINENADPDVKADILRALDRMVPASQGFAHSEGNSDAHMMAALVGSSATIPVAGGRLALGTWQGVYFCEFDGPRERKLFVQVLGA